MADSDSRDLIRRQHDEWIEHHLRWRFLQDSLEGGDRYRYAVYGYDTGGYPVMNLVRHRREYPPESEGRAIGMSESDGGVMGSVPATDNDFALRLIRTPVPTFLNEAITKHLGRIYSREVGRDGPAELNAWWADVDGRGTTVDDWFAETVAPLLLALGQLDLQFDRPRTPPGTAIRTRADETALGVNRCNAGLILPENMLWWRLTPSGKYAECLVLEYREDATGRLSPTYRHWTSTESSLYDEQGNALQVVPHPYGQVPIVRVFGRKKTRCRNVGQPEYEAIADRQREYYNRDSELILSDTIQAHPLLQGPEDYIREDGTISIGPSYLLPKKKVAEGSSPFYENWEYAEAPKGAAESIRLNKQDIRDAIDRDASLIKPAGSAGTGAGMVGQSGRSKEFDHAELNDLLTRRAKGLARAERIAAEMALVVIRGGPVSGVDRARIAINYPAEFHLFTAESLSGLLGSIQGTLASAGALPETEGEILKRLTKLAVPGLSDERYRELDSEVERYLSSRSTEVERA